MRRNFDGQLFNCTRSLFQYFYSLDYTRPTNGVYYTRRNCTFILLFNDRIFISKFLTAFNYTILNISARLYKVNLFNFNLLNPMYQIFMCGNIYISSKYKNIKLILLIRTRIINFFLSILKISISRKMFKKF
jgi:hypothetical protein